MGDGGDRKKKREKDTEHQQRHFRAKRVQKHRQVQETKGSCRMWEKMAGCALSAGSITRRSSRAAFDIPSFVSMPALSIRRCRELDGNGIAAMLALTWGHKLE